MSPGASPTAGLALMANRPSFSILASVKDHAATRDPYAPPPTLLPPSSLSFASSCSSGKHDQGGTGQQSAEGRGIYQRRWCVTPPLPRSLLLPHVLARHVGVEDIVRSVTAPVAAAAPDSPTGEAPAKRSKRSPPAMDFSRYQSRYVALHVMYLGHKYYGLAAQSSAADTIEVRRCSRLRLAPCHSYVPLTPSPAGSPV